VKPQRSISDEVGPAAPGERDDEQHGAAGGVRIDKWLWAARFYKTRSMATDAVNGGHVHINGQRVKPARDVRPGDTVAVLAGWDRRTVIVRALDDRRGPAQRAAALYEETAESRQAREAAQENRRLTSAARMELPGRPTKRNRRAIERLKGR